MIIFGSNFEGLWKVPASGGTAVPLTVLDASRKEREHELPSFLPDGKHFIYLRVAGDPTQTGVYAGSVDDPPDRQSEKLILKTGYGAKFVPTSDGSAGELLFLENGSLMSQSFDPDKLELLGSPNVIVESVGSVFETGYFSAAKNILIYRNANTSRESQYMWLDRQGKGIGKAGEPGLLGAARISNDGKLLAYEKAPKADAGFDIWILDVARDTSSRLTFGPGDSGSPVWSPDDREIAYAANRGGSYDLYRKAANGSDQEELLFKSKEDKRPYSWSRDGRFLIFGSSLDRGLHEKLWVLPMQGEHKPFPFSQTKFEETEGQFSPDGRWVAYSSDETGRYEIYLKEFNGSPEAISSGGKWTISNDSGRAPKWRADGKVLLYRNPNRGTLESVDISTTSQSVNAGVPKNLFTLPGGPAGGAMATDAQQFLYATPVEQTGVEAFTVVVNWPSVLQH